MTFTSKLSVHLIYGYPGHNCSVTQWPNLRSSGRRQYITLNNINFLSKFVQYSRRFNNNNNNNRHTLSVFRPLPLCESHGEHRLQNPQWQQTCPEHTCYWIKIIMEVTMNAKYSSTKEIRGPESRKLLLVQFGIPLKSGIWLFLESRIHWGGI